MDIVISKNNVPIRLTSERWLHISTGHPEMVDYYYEILETVESPDILYNGNNNAIIAVKNIKENVNKFIVVIYKESSANDGYIITAFLTNKQQTFKNKKIIWKQ